MKKPFLFFIVLVVIAGAIAVTYFWRLSGRSPAVSTAELRAYMQDEDADLPDEPAVGLTVNDSDEPVLVANAPMLFTVGVANPRANQRATSLTSLSDKIKSLSAMPQTPGTAKRLKLASDDYQKKLKASAFTIGDSTHAWSEALHIVQHNGSTNTPLLFALQGFDAAKPQPVTLGAANAVEATYGAAVTPLAPGSYSFAACLGPTGSWQGTSCSDPVQVKVVSDIAELTPEQQAAFTRHTAHYATLTKDWNKLEQIAKMMAVKDPFFGRISLGDAKFGQQKWKEALAEYVAARAMLKRQNPDLPEEPRYLNERITQVVRNMQDQE